MNQSSSTSNMPRSTVTVETLKQIQKQGLSISIISQDSGRSIPLETPVAKETRSKQATLDKQVASKAHIVADDSKKMSPRTTIPDNKSSMPLGRLANAAETRSVAHLLTSSPCTFHESKTANQPRANQPSPATSESKTFSTSTWNSPSNSTSLENKNQASTSRLMQNVSVTAEGKNQTTPGRLLTSQSARSGSNTNLLSEKNPPQKTVPARAASLVQKTLISESKGAATPSRMTPNHPSVHEGSVGTQNARSSSGASMLPEKNTPNRLVNVPVSQMSLINESKAQASRMTNNMLLIEGKSPANTPGRKVLNATADVKSFTNQNRMNQNFASNVAETKMNSGQRNVHLKMSDGPQGKVTPNRPIDIKGAKLLTPQNVSVQDNKVQGPNSSTASDTPAKGFPVKFVMANQLEEVKLGPNVIPVKRVVATKRQPTASLFKNKNSSPVAKKKCVSRSPQTRKGATLEGKSNKSSLEDGACNDQQQFISNLKNRPSGLIITPVVSNTKSNPSSSINTSTNTTAKSDSVQNDPIIEEPPDEDSNPMFCTNCKTFAASDATWCPTCNNNLTPTTQFSPDSKLVQTIKPYIVTQNVTNVMVSKSIIFNQELMQQGGQSFHIEQQKKVFIKTGAVVQTTPRLKGRPKRKVIEPVCLTLSSDDDEPVRGFNAYEETTSNVNIFPMESEGSKSEQSSPEIHNEEENPEFDEQGFPGVTNIHEKIHEEDLEYDEDEHNEEDMDEMDVEEEEDIVEDEEEEELSEGVEEEEEESEVPPEDEEEEHGNNVLMESAGKSEHPLLCRSVRIGSFKIHPTRTEYLPIFLEHNFISFHAPTVTDPNVIVNIVLKPTDVTRMLFHFGKCLPIIFLYTTPQFGEAVRKALKMTEGEHPYFDPSSNDDKQEKITFLIDSMEEDHKRYLRFTFPGENKVREIDQKLANEILVKSTPNSCQSLVLKSDMSSMFENQMPITMTPVQQQQMTIKVVPQQPVVKILTYPPPPQTGGIPVTSEDLACLNEGEFLNDVIIDFYLKYVFYEKLSDYNREKTHIFSSYFYPRLTSKTDKPRASEDGQKTVQVRRHSQVKTWTRHIDIFSKDYIIIPVNQNVHWFLAIICYPGKVPDAPPAPVNQEAKANKPADGVTSTDDQEDAAKLAPKEQNSNAEGSSTNNDENSMPSSNNSLYEAEDSPDSEEPCPEAPDSSTHPDGSNRKRKETPCICIFDSLSGPNRWRIAATLREYLEMEWKMKKGTRRLFDRNTMQGFIIRCPQQTNYSDCGVYLLQYVESFFDNPIPYFGNPMPDLSSWFSETRIAKKRQELKDLILNLQKKQSQSSAS